MTRHFLKASDIRGEASGKPDDKDAECSVMPITSLWEVEKQAIEDAIDQCDGNILKAAELMDINPSTIHRKRKKWQSLTRIDGGLEPVNRKHKMHKTLFMGGAFVLSHTLAMADQVVKVVKYETTPAIGGKEDAT